MIKPNYTSWTADEGPSAGYQAGMFVRNLAGAIFAIIQVIIVGIIFTLFFAGPGLLESWLERHDAQSNSIPPTFSSRCEASGVFID